jgi:hypothetical protein
MFQQPHRGTQPIGRKFVPLLKRFNHALEHFHALRLKGIEIRPLPSLQTEALPIFPRAQNLGGCAGYVGPFNLLARNHTDRIDSRPRLLKVFFCVEISTLHGARLTLILRQVVEQAGRWLLSLGRHRGIHRRGGLRHLERLGGHVGILEIAQLRLSLHLELLGE